MRGHGNATMGTIAVFTKGAYTVDTQTADLSNPRNSRAAFLPVPGLNICCKPAFNIPLPRPFVNRHERHSAAVRLCWPKTFQGLDFNRKEGEKFLDFQQFLDR